MSLTKTQRVLITNVIFLKKFALEISDMTSDLLFEFHVTYHIIYHVKICTCVSFMYARYRFHLLFMFLNIVYALIFQTFWLMGPHLILSFVVDRTI